MKSESNSNSTGHYLVPRKDVNHVISSHGEAKDERSLIWAVVYALITAYALGALSVLLWPTWVY